MKISQEPSHADQLWHGDHGPSTLGWLGRNGNVAGDITHYLSIAVDSHDLRRSDETLFAEMKEEGVDSRGVSCPRPQDKVSPTNHLASVRSASRRQRHFLHPSMLARGEARRKGGQLPFGRIAHTPATGRLVRAAWNRDRSFGRSSSGAHQCGSSCGRFHRAVVELGTPASSAHS
jgi:hypothetical protein